MWSSVPLPCCFCFDLLLLTFDVNRAAALKGAMSLLSEMVTLDNWLYSSEAWPRAISLRIPRELKPVDFSPIPMSTGWRPKRPGGDLRPET